MNDRARLGQECCEGWAQSPDGQAAPPPQKRQPRGATGLKPGGWVGRKISPELGQGGK